MAWEVINAYELSNHCTMPSDMIQAVGHAMIRFADERREAEIVEAFLRSRPSVAEKDIRAFLASDYIGENIAGRVHPGTWQYDLLDQLGLFQR